MKFITKIGSLLKKVFSGAYDLLQDKGYIAVLVTNNLKSIIQSPVIDIITAVIPGEIDNLIASKLRVFLPKVAFKVAMVHGVISTHERPSVALKILFEHLGTLSKSEQTKFWIDFAAELNLNLEDGNLSIHESIKRTQDLYKKFFKKKTE
jgi:hypothetical protein